jgi:sugar/nucleoside kinase (ribokinase family)
VRAARQRRRHLEENRMKRFDVYGIGNALVDLQVRASDEDLASLGLQKGGMQLVGEAEQGKILQHFRGRDLARSSGGSAANSMIAIAQLGGRAAYGCIVSDDDLGAHYQQEMAGLGVVLHNSGRLGAPTGSSLILITPDAERTMNTHLGITSEFSPDDVNDDLIANAEWLYVEGYLLSSEVGQLAVRHAVNVAQRCGTKIALAVSAAFIVDAFGGPLKECAAVSDLVFANRDEATRFSGCDDEQRASASLKATVPGVVMTLGERGALIHVAGTSTQVEPFPAVATDDTGAGDMFAGAFLYGLTHGLAPHDAGRLACFLSSKVVSQLGARLRADVPGLVAGAGFVIPKAG